MRSRTFAIGDVHGCALTLQHLLFKIIRLRKDDRIFMLGDLIDRGPRSKEVIDTLMKLRDSGYFVKSIRGNHEEMLLDACHDRSKFLLWIENGGLSTLKSFKVEDACEIPISYRKFLADLPYYIQLNKFVLCHAGINCNIADPFTDTVSMLWNPNHEIIPDKIENKRLICGHSIQSLEKISRSLDSNRIYMDAGCVFKDRESYGNLAALEIESMTILHTHNIDF